MPFQPSGRCKAPQVISQLIWRNVVQAGRYLGSAVAGHEDHVHLALLKQYAFNAAVMARIISRAARGLSIQICCAAMCRARMSMLSMSARSMSRARDHLRISCRRSIGKVRDAANKFIDKKASKRSSSPGTLRGELRWTARSPLHGSGRCRACLQSQGTWRLLARPGFRRAPSRRSLRRIGLSPGVISVDGGYGLWQITPRVQGA